MNTKNPEEEGRSVNLTDTPHPILPELQPNILTRQSNYSLQECFAALKFNRPANAQRYLQDRIDELNQTNILDKENNEIADTDQEEYEDGMRDAEK